MAASLGEKQNFCRLMKLLSICGTKALQSFLHETLLDGSKIHVFKENIEKLKADKLISQQQYQQIHPTSDVLSSIKDLDITLVTILLRSACGLSPPKNGWNALPDAHDISESGCIATIKYYRNYFAHMNTYEIKSQDYEEHWRKLARAIEQLDASCAKKEERGPCISDFEQHVEENEVEEEHKKLIFEEYGPVKTKLQGTYVQEFQRVEKIGKSKSSEEIIDTQIIEGDKGPRVGIIQSDTSSKTSTYLSNIALDWAEKEESPVAKKYQFVFYLDVDDMHRETALSEIVEKRFFSQGLEEGLSWQYFWKSLNKIEDEVLFLLNSHTGRIESITRNEMIKLVKKRKIFARGMVIICAPEVLIKWMRDQLDLIYVDESTNKIFVTVSASKSGKKNKSKSEVIDFVFGELMSTKKGSLRKHLKNKYKMQLKIHKEPLYIEFTSDSDRGNGSRENLVRDVENGNIERFFLSWLEKNMHIKQFLPLWKIEFVFQAPFEINGEPLDDTDGALCTDGASASPSVEESRIVAPTEDIKFAKANQIFLITVGMIKDKKFYPYDFFKHLAKHMKDCNFKEKVTEEGLTVLHLTIVENRSDFLAALFRLGLFAELIKIKVKIPANTNQLEVENTYDGMTAEAIARKLNRIKVIETLTYLKEFEESMMPIHLAARCGDLSKVKELLDSEPKSIIQTAKKNTTALYWAVTNGSEQVIRALVDAGAERFCMTEEEEENLVWRAVSLGHAQVISILVREYKIPAEKTGPGDMTAIEKTAENGDVESLKMLVEAGVRPVRTMIPLCCAYGRIGYLRHLFENHKGFVDVEYVDSLEKTGLIRAAESGHNGVVDFLIQKKANITKLDKRGRNAAHYAAENGHLECIKSLVVAAKDRSELEKVLEVKDRYVGSELCFLVRGRDRGRSAWHYVEIRRRLLSLFIKRTKGGSLDVADFGKVIKSGWGLDPPKDIVTSVDDQYSDKAVTENTPKDLTPLSAAILKDHEAVVLEMLKVMKKDQVDIKDKFGLTPLHLACMRGRLTIIQELEKLGASLATKSMEGDKTPLQVAEENDNKAVVNYIKGKDVIEITKTFLDERLEPLLNQVRGQEIEERRESGDDLRRHIISTLREITTEINIHLMDMGSGPVLEETSADPTGQ